MKLPFEKQKKTEVMTQVAERLSTRLEVLISNFSTNEKNDMKSLFHPRQNDFTKKTATTTKYWERCR
jgi:hypothetical protein